MLAKAGVDQAVIRLQIADEHANLAQSHAVAEQRLNLPGTRIDFGVAIGGLDQFDACSVVVRHDRIAERRLFNRAQCGRIEIRSIVCEPDRFIDRDLFLAEAQAEPAERFLRSAEEAHFIRQQVRISQHRAARVDRQADLNPRPALAMPTSVRRSCSVKSRKPST